MINTNKQFHIENPFITEDSTIIKTLKEKESLKDLTFKNSRNLIYQDYFFDTEHFDLHASAKLLRARVRQLN